MWPLSIFHKNIYNEKEQEIVRKDLEIIKNGDYISKIDKYFNCFYEEQANLLEYLSDQYLICIDEENKVNKRSENIKIDNQNIIKSLLIIS